LKATERPSGDVLIDFETRGQGDDDLGRRAAANQVPNDLRESHWVLAATFDIAVAQSLVRASP
jgi:hypothetical protein